ncbi:hypothetical protein FC62_GL000345 [Amylolactobacillus amylotrophicus DSM 20534]|uniref:Uncharacterized protein n=3 Tax=Amylolactobacillus TaxID=2767876 RepID=A0A0R1YU74_9LACO|nr:MULTISPECIES: glycine cleavage system protein H [Amylolactobacillus]APT19077.1 hypothetical protein LA20533_07385 [Amylolactobacillus amylophilus DSM 20533 = JCM 1125]KRK38657.1 hypothetical protein FC62_GL000345 [Amylolactobacillus amylotrophicus DSM 20534]KRM42700.1 hypothetical protein FD40_GL000494 [Amylolactobacillus amylophilus DSM 20533 = JCM 1125]GED79560.1 hypothetical protein LAM01_00330 [Amylolactobacillus amylophilus]
MDTTDFFWQEETAEGTRIGLNDAGRQVLGKVKFVSLPETDTKVEQGKHLFDVEAEKTVLDIDSPLSGQIVARNEEVEDNPDYLDLADHAKNWLFLIK